MQRRLAAIVGPTHQDGFVVRGRVEHWMEGWFGRVRGVRVPGPHDKGGMGRLFIAGALFEVGAV